MTQIFGILFALIALFGWAFGDFFIQKTTRAIGIWKALFFIGLFGGFSLFPFVLYQGMPADAIRSLLPLLLLLVAATLFAALFDFAALKEGKIAIIEPIIGLELPIAVSLSIALGHEQLTLAQSILIGVISVGILFTITKRRRADSDKKITFEKGLILAGLGAIGLALTNFLVGVASRVISPIFLIWFTHTMLAVICALYFTIKKTWKTVISDFGAHRRIIIAQSILDNMAWLAYAHATRILPISITVAMSESYIALAALLGMTINREKLRPYQMVGVIITIGSVILLAQIMIH